MMAITTGSSRRWWALGGLTVAVLAVGLDVTVLSVALPTLATDLGASMSDLQWFSSGYALVLAAAMIPVGLIGDRYGRKKTLIGGLLLFALASAGCAYSNSPGTFIAARAVLGLAGAAVIVMALSALTVLFSAEERPRAVGVWAAANFVAFPIGPIFGGWLLTNYWWGWVFLMNVPVALLGIVAVVLLVPASRAPEPPGLDPIGMFGGCAGLTALTYGLIEAGDKGWGWAGTVASLTVGVVVLAALAGWERWLSRRPGGQPLIDPDLFRSRSFTWGVILAAIGVLAMVGVLFTLPLYFQGVRGVDAMGSGLRLLPLVGGLMVGALPADRLAARIGARITVALGYVLVAAAMLIGAATGVASGEGFIAGWMALAGAGMGLLMATAASAALSQLSAERSGVGSAVMQALQKIGAPFGAAILGSVLSSAYQGRLPVEGLPAAAAETARSGLFGGIAVAQQTGSQQFLDSVYSAFVHGMDVALVVSVAVAAAGILLSLIFLPGGRRPGRSQPADAAARGDAFA
jgi:DHA2 family multidrug resistance protein-like MFS transporter